MIRFAWLQFRMQVALAAGALAIVAIVLAVTGPNLVHLYDTTVVTCAAQHDCSTATTAFTDTDGPLQVFLDFLLLLVPVLIGMFWGAPLVAREFESGTFRLVWTQGITRPRWLAVKLGLGALASMAVAGLLSLMVSWWSSQLDFVNGEIFDPLRFGVRGIVPIGYAAFAFMLGLTAGLLFRRMLPAMMTAVFGFFAVREIMTRWVRPYLFAPLHKSMPITAASPLVFEGTPPAWGSPLPPEVSCRMHGSTRTRSSTRSVMSPPRRSSTMPARSIRRSASSTSRPAPLTSPPSSTNW